MVHNPFGREVSERLNEPPHSPTGNAIRRKGSLSAEGGTFMRTPVEGRCERGSYPSNAPSREGPGRGVKEDRDPL